MLNERDIEKISTVCRSAFLNSDIFTIIVFYGNDLAINKKKVLT